jgi:branched-chain amino acid transport system ATP-binding protein
VTLFEIDGLTKRFGGLVAVDDLSFSVDEGELVGLIGPNGSGKSTVFNCIMSTYTPTEGRITFEGEDITYDKTYEVVNSGLARVSQESNPIDMISVGGNIKLFMLPDSFLACALPDTVLAKRSGDGPGIVDHAERVGLGDKLRETPDSLAHADIRRLEIAKALATGPDMLLLDEPFAGMNQAEVRELSEEIESLREEGITIIIVDHNMRGMMQLVDRVVVLSSGQKLAEGSPEEIVNDQTVQDAYLAGEQGGI